MARRLWLAAVVLLFCAPLFIGLRNRDLENDEAIYSFAVDRILEVGQWLQPKSSPNETAVFLEKPPLKFWIVAAPIKAGLLPHDELGLRFWDALFGATAFVYVFFIGTMLAGEVCGAVAVFVLFVHWPLLIEHGIRGNNMEAALVLSYCGGIFHGLRWLDPQARRRTGHAIALGLYFVLGFMVKFVAAIFLPAILLLPSLLFRRGRRAFAGGWKTWLAVSALALALIAPWFVYAYVVFGRHLIEIMLAEHVYARFTTGLVAEHVNPWHFYFSTMWSRFAYAQVEWLVAAGGIVLILQTIRRRWLEGAVVVAWAALTLIPISFGSSKLYHYAYPFLPPFALGAGYLVALVMMLAPVQLRKIGAALESIFASIPGIRVFDERRFALGLTTVAFWFAAMLAVGALLFGTVRLEFNQTLLIKSSGVVRPLIVMALAAILARRTARAATLVTALAVGSILPIPAYKEMWQMIEVKKHPIRDTSQCVQRVQREMGDHLRQGVGVDTDSFMWHSMNYYFRRVRPLVPVVPMSDHTIDDALGPSPWPLLVSAQRYQAYRRHLAEVEGPNFSSPPLAEYLDYVVLLPGPYRSCSPESRALQ